MPGNKLIYRAGFIIILLFCLSFTADNTLKQLFTIRAKADYFTTDNIGNTYLVKSDEIRKYSASGDFLKAFSSLNLGKIASIDASNAMRILVFYKDFSSLIFLDDQLSQNGDVINLLDLSLEQSDLVCNSFNNGLWFFDRQNAALVRLDGTLQTIANTGNLNRLLNTNLKPNFLLEYDGKVYLNNPDEGILIFDVYGTYFKTIPIKGLQHFQVRDGNLLVYFQNNAFKSYNMKLLTETVIDMPGVSDARMEKENYFLFYKDSVMVKTTN